MPRMMTEDKKMIKKELFEQVRSCLASNSIADAVALLGEVCANGGADAEIWTLYANVLLQTGNVARTEKCLREAVRLDPENASVLYNLGCALAANNKFDEAEHYLARVTMLDARHSSASDMLGQIHEQRGHVEQAKSYYENAVRGDSAESGHFRRLGVILLKSRNPAEAEKCFQEGIRLGVSDAKAFVELGRAQCELGKVAEAEQAFNRALQLNPDLRYAQFWLSAINDQSSTDAAKHRFVSRLFDGHAADFNEILVGQLGYKTPWLLADAMKGIVGPGRLLDVLDLGCGTGLCANSFEEMTNSIDGVDLSGNMLDEARKLGKYRALVQGDLVEAMSGMKDRYDLVLAADVFVYVGGLERVFRSCKDLLNEGGYFAFTVEISDHQDGYMLRATGRYAHSDIYIRQLAAGHGFDVIQHENTVLRTDAGSPIYGVVYVLGNLRYR